MIAQGNSVYLSWIDIDKNTGQKQVLFRESNDNGQTFEKPIILSNNLNNSMTTVSFFSTWKEKKSKS